MYDEILGLLREAYDRKAGERDGKRVEDWKAGERSSFLHLLEAEGARTLLEIGAGPGIHAQFFQEHGLSVVATDLSPEMVKRCRQKGLPAHVMDFMHLDFPDASFDAAFGMNCLLHVPIAELPGVLASVQRVLRAGGLFYWGQYGGVFRQEVNPEDHYEPKRFYALLTDAQIVEAVEAFFELVSFRPIELPAMGELHFQSTIWRKPAEAIDGPH